VSQDNQQVYLLFRSENLRNQNNNKIRSSRLKTGSSFGLCVFYFDFYFLNRLTASSRGESSTTTRERSKASERHLKRTGPWKVNSRYGILGVYGDSRFTMTQAHTHPHTAEQHTHTHTLLSTWFTCKSKEKHHHIPSAVKHTHIGRQHKNVQWRDTHIIHTHTLSNAGMPHTHTRTHTHKCVGNERTTDSDKKLWIDPVTHACDLFSRNVTFVLGPNDRCVRSTSTGMWIPLECVCVFQTQSAAFEVGDAVMWSSVLFKFRRLRSFSPGNSGPTRRAWLQSDFIGGKID